MSGFIAVKNKPLFSGLSSFSLVTLVRPACVMDVDPSLKPALSPKVMMVAESPVYFWQSLRGGSHDHSIVETPSAQISASTRRELQWSHDHSIVETIRVLLWPSSGRSNSDRELLLSE